MQRRRRCSAENHTFETQKEHPSGKLWHCGQKYFSSVAPSAVQSSAIQSSSVVFSSVQTNCVVPDGGLTMASPSQTYLHPIMKQLKNVCRVAPKKVKKVRRRRQKLTKMAPQAPKNLKNDPPKSGFFWSVDRPVPNKTPPSGN